MEFSELNFGDMVVAYKRFIGYITHIDRKNDTADVEWEEEDGWNTANIPLRYLEKLT